ncbi:hypothetical protein A2U01_0040468, partial [Trifolium medium]|nr:hypothetical protein [Trifolium medium]
MMVQEASLNGEMQKTTHVIKRDSHLSTGYMEAAGLSMSSLYKHSQQAGIKERESH